MFFPPLAGRKNAWLKFYAVTFEISKNLFNCKNFDFFISSITLQRLLAAFANILGHLRLLSARILRKSDMEVSVWNFMS